MLVKGLRKLQLAGFGAAVYAVIVRGRQRSAIADVLADTLVDDPFAHIVRGYPEALSMLVKAVEVKDAYTHGHSLRTAELAVELGLQMALPPDRLRIIARGAYLHDLGEIAVPDQILNKPGALTDEERRIVEMHPQHGYGSRLPIGLAACPGTRPAQTCHEIDLVKVPAGV